MRVRRRRALLESGIRRRRGRLGVLCQGVVGILRLPYLQHLRGVLRGGKAFGCCLSAEEAWSVWLYSLKLMYRYVRTHLVHVSCQAQFAVQLLMHSIYFHRHLIREEPKASQGACIVLHNGGDEEIERRSNEAVPE